MCYLFIYFYLHIFLNRYFACQNKTILDNKKNSLPHSILSIYKVRALYYTTIISTLLNVIITGIIRSYKKRSSIFFSQFSLCYFFRVYLYFENIYPQVDPFYYSYSLYAYIITTILYRNYKILHLWVTIKNK